MRFNLSMTGLFRSTLAASTLLLVSGLSFAASAVVNLTAAPSQAVLPDGRSVPMWGYLCGTGNAAASGGATCAASNPNAGPNWSPVMITVPTGSPLVINLTNNLSFTPTGGAAPNNVPTSLVIVGQLGGGLGDPPATTPSPTHAVQTNTWFVAGDTTGATNTPPPQPARVQSFATEVAATGATPGSVPVATSLTWNNLRPGTYLIHSGTHPSIQAPMGLYGILVVTNAPVAGTPNVQGTAYPNVGYDADLALLLSEIDPQQNSAVDAAVRSAGFKENSAILMRDVLTSLSLATDAGGNVINAGSGYAVNDAVTIPAGAGSGGGSGGAGYVDTVGPGGSIVSMTVTSGGTGYTSVPSSVQVTSPGGGTGAQLAAALSRSGSLCSDSAAACYPPAVNYDPRYYLINGVSFDRTLPTGSLFGATAAYASTGNVLVRFANAGLRMHIPSIVGALTGGNPSATPAVPPAPGFALVAEDGNVLPGSPRVQTQVFMAAGKTYDVLINTPASGPALPVFDRQLSLSTNNEHDGGMQAYIGVNGAALASGLGTTAGAAGALNKTYYCAARTPLVVTDPSKGVLGGATGANGATLGSFVPGNLAAADVLAFNPNGTFTYTPDPTMATCGGTFTFLVNGTNASTATITQCDVTTAGSTNCSGVVGQAPTAHDDSYTSNVGSYLKISPPGLLANDTDVSGLLLKVDTTSIVNSNTGALTLGVNPDGSFTAWATAPGQYTFTYNIKNSQGTASLSPATVTLNFPTPSNLKVNVADAIDGSVITDFRWIIEEDRTWYSDPKCQINSTDPTVRPASCPPLPVESLAYSFHTASMPVIATGCVGAVSCESGQSVQGVAAACDQGNGVCHFDAVQKIALDPSQVALDPAKRYFLSILPGDAINPTLAGTGVPVPKTDAGGKPVLDGAGKPVMRQFTLADCTSFAPGTGDCGHGMGGAPVSGAQIAAGQVKVVLQRTPLPTAKLAVFVYQDDNPLNGENDAGGGVDVLAPQEPGLGGFELKIFDQAGGLGDPTGQITYDMFNYPVSNSLAGTVDPMTGWNACPITVRGDGLVGMIPVCPKYESDGKTLSPLAGQAVIANLYPGLYEIVATPAADRIARGEEWLQTNTLDGGRAHEASIKPNEPAYFQEFGPGGFHVSIGFANPKIINDRKTNSAKTGLCDPAPNGGGLTCNSSLTVNVAKTHMSRTPDQRVYSSGDYTAYNFTQCYVAMGPPDGADFAFGKCDANGQVTFSQIPDGDWKLVVFDQWNDLTLDGLVNAVTVNGSTIKEFPVTQWRTNMYTRTFLDVGGAQGKGAGDGVSNFVVDANGVANATEPGLTLVPTNIRYRDGSFGFKNNTDLNGYANFNEVFPFMNWLVVEADTTRFKTTGVHTVYDTGGPVDGSSPNGTACKGVACGDSTIAARLANTLEQNSLPVALRVPGAVYCADADCSTTSILNGTYYNPAGSSGPLTGLSSARIDPPMPWGTTQAWQGLLGQSSFIEFGMKPFVPGENGGIKGHVIYASTRPFDDPQLLLQASWEPGVPRVKINLYQQGTAPDGTTSMKLVDSTTSTSWDDWAQGFRRNINGDPVAITDPSTGKTGYVPNMNCPGQAPDSPFFDTLKGSTQFLDQNAPKLPLAANSQFKCFDGWAQLNQVQPAPYDGMYKFPSVTGVDPATGRPAKTNCTACVTNPDDGNPMLPSGKYVVEVIVPPGFELVKEEDKNILMGDIYIAPVSQQFVGLGNIFIIPDQAAVNATYNKNNPQIPNTNLGSATLPRSEGDTGVIETYWPCVGAMRVVPDYMSLYPATKQNSPFAGALRPLCDRKEVTLSDQAAAQAKFYIFTPTHIAGHFTGTITNDFASEFDPFSPQFGEKFGPPNLPVSMRDFAGNEVNRVYSDQWGVYNGLFTSTWEVNPPNPTGYAPQMSVACMNDPGPIPDGKGGMMIDPAYSPAYSNFCYETPFMPGFTAYMDTPVIPVQAFADAYTLPDAEYPDTTPALKSVTGGSGVLGPWVSASGQTLTITALGDKSVANPLFSGPNASTAPYNQKTITRHYGFGPQPPACLVASGSCPNVTIGGVPMTNVVWSDMAITGTVPAGVPNCALQQQGQPAAQCGELAITAVNGKQSIDTVTVTIGGKTPKVVAAENVAGNAIQAAIDAAAPGDLIIVGPGSYKEHLIMWQPVRLQGVGANAVTLNADAHPAGVLDPWRRQVNCVFGLTIQGVPNLNNATYDPSGQYSCPANMFQRVDRIPFEAIVGWDATGNGNLAQVLQEPTLMGAYEGAGITVLGRGVKIPAASSDFWGLTATGGAGAFTDGSVWLTPNDCAASTTETDGRDYGTSNFMCNPSRIDGLAIINSSQGGGAVFIHGWAHNLEVANTRIFANQGTLTGGINVGNGETPDAYINDGTECGVNPPVMPCPTIPAGTAANAVIPFQFNTNVHIHHNAIYDNASIGDALFSGTPTGAGGVTISAGSDQYQLDHNWIAGNLTTGDGGGVQHVGLSFSGRINNNWILFNQSTNPTLPTNGGGLAIMGANVDRNIGPIAGNECGSTNDADCTPGLGEGAGAHLVVDANLILGNSAESGSGGGLRLQQINGSEVGAFPATPARWYDITVTNNIIVNNVAGWDGAGVSMEDTLKATIVNNTIASNDTTASAGVLFKTLGAANASSPPPGCDPAGIVGPLCTQGGNAAHNPQPAGLVTVKNTPNMVAALTGLNVTCPAGYGYTGGTGSGALVNANCALLSIPLLTNNLFWQNRAFHVEISGMGSGLKSQQNLVVMVPALNQDSTGQCKTSGFDAQGQPMNAAYWDVGVRDDVHPNDGLGGAKLSLTNSILTPLGAGVPSYLGTGNLYPTASPVLAQYCNGSRVPPENGGHGYNAPAGRSETTGLSTVFTFNNIAPAVTVDEGNNWVNLVYGPLTMSTPAAYSAGASTSAELMAAGAATGTANGAYSIPLGSPAVDNGTTAGAPDHDFYGNPRPSGNGVDIGAVEFPKLGLTPATATFSSQAVLTTSAPLVFKLNNPPAGTSVSIGSIALSNTTDFAIASNTCGASLAPGANCTIGVTFTPNLLGAKAATLTVTDSEGTQTASLTGTGSGKLYSVNPTSLGFPNTVVNTVSAPLSVAVRNNQTTPMTFTALGLSGLFPTEYSIVAGANACSTATPVASGASCNVYVTFNPQLFIGLAGTRPASLGLSASGLNSVVSLNGRGLAYPVYVTPQGMFGINGMLIFPITQVGQASTRVATLNNLLSTPVTFNSASMPSQFKIVSGPQTTCTNGSVVPPANGATPGTCTIAIQYAPDTCNSFFGFCMPSFGGATLNLAGSPVNPSILLIGMPALPSARLTGTGAFGNLPVATTSATRQFTYTNTGIGQITVSAVTKGGSSAADYAITSNTCVTGGAGVTLAPQASCQMGVSFTPSAAGTRSATLTVSDTAGGAGSLAVNLSGTGLARATTSPGNLAFGNKALGSVSATQTVTLSNPAGNPSMTGTSIAFGNAAYFRRPQPGGGSCSTNATFTLNGGNSCTIVVVFAPPKATAGGTTGSKSGTLTISTTSAVPAPTPPITLGGTATQ